MNTNLTDNILRFFIHWLPSVNVTRQELSQLLGPLLTVLLTLPNTLQVLERLIKKRMSEHLLMNNDKDIFLKGFEKHSLLLDHGLRLYYFAQNNVIQKRNIMRDQ